MSEEDSSLKTVSCPLCRHPAGVPLASGWLTRVRALYPTPDGHHRISAVGTYPCEQDLNVIKVPTDGNESEVLTFEMPEHSDDRNTLQSLEGAPFIIHDACWDILKGYSYDTSIPLDELADALSDTWGRYFDDVDIDEKKLADPTEPIKIRSSDLSLLEDVHEPSRAVAQRRKESVSSNRDVFTMLPPPRNA